MSLFKKEEKIEEKNIESTSLVNDYLISIDLLISKLTLINISHGKSPYLSSEIQKYKSELTDIERCYSNVDINDTSILNYQKRIEYLTKLSILRDEINNFSIPYLYKEKLNVIKNTDINKDNIEEVKKELLDIEKSILSKTFDKEVTNELYGLLYEVIYIILKKENIYSDVKDLYNKISDISCMEIDGLFLKELIEVAEIKKAIKNYIDKNDIGNIRFDYSILDKLYSEEKEEIKEEEKEEQSEENTQSSNKIEVYKKPIINIFGKKCPELTLLSYDIAKKYFIYNSNILKCSATDFAILLAGDNLVKYKNSQNVCEWYLSTNHTDHDDVDIIRYEIPYSTLTSDTSAFIRPIIKDKKLISKLIKNGVYGFSLNDNLVMVKYGEYVQDIISSKETKYKLDFLHYSGKLEETGVTYTVAPSYVLPLKELEEYYYEGYYYVRFYNSKIFLEDSYLKDIEKYEYVWLRVEPVNWIVDKKNGLMISSKALFGGIPFDKENTYNGKIKDTSIYEFMNNTLANDLLNYQKRKKLR